MEERRTQERYTINSVEYITFAGGNGGIIVDISGAGLGVQTVAALQPSTMVDFSVVVPQVGAPIEGSAHVIWVTRRGQAGLRVAEVPEVARHRIAEWIRKINTSSEDASETEDARQIQTVPSGTNVSSQFQAEVQEDAAAPKPSADWAQVVSDRGTAPVTKESNGDTMGISATSDAAEMSGPFSLSHKVIEDCVRQKGWGVYMVGKVESNRFLVMRLARSSALANDLGSYLREYEAFKFTYCVSERRAFQQECELYHRFRPPKNKSHPRKPPEADWDCPVCRGFS